MAKITFLGTGLIGAGLAEAAAKRGDQVTVYNRTASKARALEAFGVRVSESVAEAVQGAERVHIVVSDDAAVDSLIAQAGDLTGSLVIDHSTTAPAGTRARAEALAARGVAFLHAPVFMSPAMCREARGIILAAGPKKVFERAEPALKAMTGSVEYAGERVDMAAAQKLFGNAMILVITAGLADVFAIAKSLDLTAGDVQALYKKFNPAATLTYRGVNMAKGDFAPSFELTMARKDVRLMIETAEATSETLAVLPAIASRMDELIRRGHGGDDVGVMAVDAVPKKAL